ncbi:MAG: histidine kinase N-terminal 7TM domain-containing protein [Candidatus Margulisiibacteriota bacterium]
MLDSILGLAYFTVIGANIILSLVVLYRGFLNRTNMTFSLMTGFLALWVASSYFCNYFAPINTEFASFWFRMRFLSIFPVPAIFMYFSLIFPENKDPGIKSLFVFIPTFALYIMQSWGLIALSIGLSDSGAIRPVYGPYISLFAIYYVAYFLLIFVILMQKYFKVRGIARLQIQYVTIGAFIPAIIGVLGNFFLPLMGVDPGIFSVLGPLSTIFISIMVSSAIVKHRLLLLPAPFLGINNALGRGLVYTVIASFIAAVYFGFLFIVAKFFQELSGNYSIFIGFLFFAVFSVIFGPVKDWLQRLVNTFLFKSKIGYEKTLRQTSSAMNFIYNRERLLGLIAKLITKRMYLTGGAFFLYDEHSGKYVIKGAGGMCKDMVGRTMDTDNPLVVRIEETQKPVLKSDVERDVSDVFVSEYERNKHKEVLREMERLNLQLCYPSVLKGKVVAFFALGGKVFGDYYDEEDLSFLSTLAAQSSMFLENFILVEKEKISAEALAKAQTRDKYTKMLEKMNKELLDTKEELVKSERMATMTMLAVPLQREIAGPLLEIINESKTFLSDTNDGLALQKDDVLRKIANIEHSSKKIREILRDLASITEPVMREYRI